MLTAAINSAMLLHQRRDSVTRGADGPAKSSSRHKRLDWVPYAVLMIIDINFWLLCWLPSYISFPYTCLAAGYFNYVSSRFILNTNSIGEL